ncbi:MAG: ACP S-malonyltransferase [Armatimonadetes bacterium]|nr:ACP S-malonyltransferase [Armatimonadota bacterium]MBX3108905.1 ACP S-malonyltransferase [Fimbriimonadaceae bacterium]
MVAVVFPGQGSQKPGMGEELYHHNTFARQVFDQVETATGVNVANLCFNSDEQTLRQTQNAQLALYTCSLAAYFALKDRCPEVEVKGMAGHSVGEYAALAAAGIISLESGARLVQRRGDIMARAGQLRPGGMAAVLGLDRAEIESALAAVSNGVAVVANDNCPGQLVISGDLDAIAEATALLNERGARRVLPLNVSGAFHSPLMAESAEAMRVALDETPFHPSAIPVYSNVTSRPGSDWPELLERQLKSPVQWTGTMEHMISDGFETFIECGAGEVLLGLLRRVDKDKTGLRVMDSATLDETALAFGGAA